MGASVPSCCLLHLFLSQMESRDQALPYPLDLHKACADFSIPPTYLYHQNRIIPCIYFILLNIHTRWITTASVSPMPGYPLQGAGGSTDAGLR